MDRNDGGFPGLTGQYASADETEDLPQEILCELWKSLDRFEGRSAAGT